MRVKHNLLVWIFVVNLICCWAYENSEFAQLQEVVKTQMEQQQNFFQKQIEQQQKQNEQQQKQIEQQQKQIEQQQIEQQRIQQRMNLQAMGTGCSAYCLVSLPLSE